MARNVQAVVWGELAKPDRSQHSGSVKPHSSSKARNTVPGTAPSRQSAHPAALWAGASVNAVETGKEGAKGRRT